MILFVDTSVVIELQRNNPQIKQVIESAEEIYEIGISRIVAMEFVFGSKDKNQLKTNLSFINLFKVYDVDERVSKLALDLVVKFNLLNSLSIPDALIAATAVHYSYPLWTLNTKHFKNIKGLKLFKS